MFELVGAFALPILVAIVPGLLAFERQRPFVGVMLLALALLGGGLLSYVMGLAVVVSSNAAPLWAIWVVTILFCLVAGGIVLALGRKRSVHREVRSD